MKPITSVGWPSVRIAGDRWISRSPLKRRGAQSPPLRMVGRMPSGAILWAPLRDEPPMKAAGRRRRRAPVVK